MTGAGLSGVGAVVVLRRLPSDDVVPADALEPVARDADEAVAALAPSGRS